uniref:GRAM domain-containing protein 2A-like isoform X3 n=1 Tax=Gasterosteus aculeatus aculeatus TaxID=481459 RepID=UPI001A981769|nr:GRAM domain-containing protein 2A-like isoform X3 [Gasterosteus aculeatus aculeatus]
MITGTCGCLHRQVRKYNSQCHKLFQTVPKDEILMKDIILQGRLYISRNFLCFYANLFGKDIKWWRKPSLPVVSLSLPTPPPASLQTHPLSRTHSQMWRVVLLAGQSEDKNLKESIREYKKKNLQLHRFPIEGRGQPGYHRDTTVPPLERSGDRRDGVVLLHNRCVGVCMYSQLHLAETYIYLTLSH